MTQGPVGLYFARSLPMETTPDTNKIPEKLFYKAAEVCQITDTQPYVLRFWESEFPQLASEKNRSGQRVYRRSDIDLVFRIKKLLYQEEYTIAGARKAIDEDRATIVDPAPPKSRAKRAAPVEEPSLPAEPAAPSSLFGETRPEAPEAPPSPAVEEQARFHAQYEEALTTVEALNGQLARSLEVRRRVAACLEAALEL